MSPVLEVKNLYINIHREGKTYPVVEDVGFSLSSQHTLCLVGESGCGKTMTALSIMGLLPGNASAAGKIIFKGENIINLDEESMRNLRGKHISMIFQDPLTSLNPVLTIYQQISEIFLAHGEKIPPSHMEKRVIEILKEVRIPDPEQKAHSYPHQLSGGLRQRVLIGMALALTPEVVIADEPTTALDVTIQAEILALFNQLKEEKHLSAIYITHDLSVVSEVGDEVLIMYAGSIVERAPKKEILHHPLHPYTIGLLHSMPSYKKRGRPLPFIPGNVPSPEEKPQGCPFYPRCHRKKGSCREKFPILKEIAPGHFVRCGVIHGE